MLHIVFERLDIGKDVQALFAALVLLHDVIRDTTRALQLFDAALRHEEQPVFMADEIPQQLLARNFLPLPASDLRLYVAHYLLPHSCDTIVAYMSGSPLILS